MEQMRAYLQTLALARLLPVHGEVSSIQHYVKQFVSDLRQVGGVLRILRFSPPIKLITIIIYCWNIVESDHKPKSSLINYI
jgi:hypothetical protein